MSETPRHLQIETYYLSEVQDVKDHVLGMVELALPENERIVRNEGWERLLYSPEGQFQVLFASLHRIKPQIGDDMHARLISMAKEAELDFVSGDKRAFAFKLQDMDDLAWKPMRANKGTTVAQN